MCSASEDFASLPENDDRQKADALTPVADHQVQPAEAILLEEISGPASAPVTNSVLRRRAIVRLFGGAVFGVGVVAFGTLVLQWYGFGLFVVLPGSLGLFGGLIAVCKERPLEHSRTYVGPGGPALRNAVRKERRLGRCLVGAALAALLPAALMLFVGLEGFVCMLMALPLWGPVALMGGVLAYWLSASIPERPRRGFPVVFPVLLLAPAVMLLERWINPAPPLFAVQSVIDIDAAPAQVWPRVVRFPELPPPEEWLFQIGVAYPTQARIKGAGVGAVRYCEFSTGPFVEPIEVWDEPNLLRFSVTDNPPPLEEWSPWGDVHPPHLHGFLVAKQGQFRLVALPDGRTRLEGTTWYHHNMWPASYWRLWSDEIIHRVHLRVLAHIKTTVEAERRAVAEREASKL